MRSAQKKTPASEKKNGKAPTSGKKLVQARLPFKILSGTPPALGLDASIPSDKLEVPPKKRKLSYPEIETENPKKIGKSDSKENLTLDKLDTEDVSKEDVIVLDDEESQDTNETSTPKTPIVATKNRKSNKSASRSSGSATTPKVQIKLPLSGKKKRKSKRPSQLAKCEVTDSSDVELVSDDHQQNPNKKPKLDESIKQSDESKEESTSNEKNPSPELHIPKKKENRKSRSKSNSIIVDLPKEGRLKGDANEDTKVSNMAETSKSSPNKGNDNSKEKTNEEYLKVFNSVESSKSSPKKVKAKKLEVPTEVPSNVSESEKLQKLMDKKSGEKNMGTEKNLKISDYVESSKSSPIKVKSPRKSEPGEKVSKKERPVKDYKATDNKSTIPKAAISEKSSASNEKSILKEPKEAKTSDPEENKTPVRKARSPRRSIRQSEAEQKKGHNETLDVLSSEPEIISEKSSAADTSIMSESRKKLLTPKQLKQMEQRKLAREEKERKLQQLKEEKDRKLQEQREERERKLQEEKIQKQKEREGRELQRKKEREEKDELKRREKEEKEEQRRKEKEDKEKKRLAEIEAKNEEKRKKDEAKEEERRKKEEDRRRKELEKEEEENKKKKAAQAFTKFFVTKTTKPTAEDDQESRDDAESVDSLAFRPFQVKGDMKLAPLVRREFKDRSRKELDSFLKGTQVDRASLYVGELKSGKHIPLSGSKTVFKDSDEEDVILIENELETAAQAIDEARPKQIQKYKAKFYFFRENRRPPFYGTWRKKSTVITPRKPFATDKEFFDYEVDSDEEWEEEEPGESLNGSEDEKDESEDEDYEVDNEWFVPHGHLSDEELQNEDELGPDTSREAQKAKLKALQQEFAQEMKKKTEKIKPRLIGAIWEDENGNRPNLCPSVIWDSLCTRAMMFCEPPLIEEPKANESEPSTPPPEKQKRIEINDDLMRDLVRLVHGNRHSRVFLIKEFMEHVSNTCDTVKNGECLAPTKTLVREKIDEISEWSVVEANSAKKKNKKKLCWIVSADVLKKYSLTTLDLRNQWSYKLQPRYDADKCDPSLKNENHEDSVKLELSDTTKSSETTKKKITPSGITKFAKVLTKEEKQNQLAATISTTSASPTVTVKNSINPKSSPKTKLTQKPAKPIVEKTQSPSSSTPDKTPVVKKRVALLMSVPPGQEFSPQSKNALISKFLQKNKTTSTLSVQEKPASSDTHMDVNAIVEFD